MSAAAIKTTVVGSYPVPDWLAAYPTTPHLRDAILVVLKTQELAGLDVISDGELSRFDVSHPETNGMIDAFVRPLGGVSLDATAAELAAFRGRGAMSFRARPAGVVRGPITEGSLDLVGEWLRLRGLSGKPLKFTLTSPYMLARTLIDGHYGDERALAMAIAAALAACVGEIDAAVVQVDEAHLPGHPEHASWAAEAMNVVLDAITAERAVHLCFGNYGGQTIQHGRWRDLVSFFNALHADHLVLEFARRGYDEIDRLREVRDEIGLGIGVIDIKDNEIESPEVVARRIEAAAARVGAERIRWVHPDCGFWMLPRSVADGKMAALVAGRDLYLGRPT